MVDCGTNFHGLILLVVELAISLGPSIRRLI
ncbi:conserved hypothetical protein, partial [Trichinella spiralis]